IPLLVHLLGKHPRGAEVGEDDVTGQREQGVVELIAVPRPTRDVEFKGRRLPIQARVLPGASGPRGFRMTRTPIPPVTGALRGCLSAGAHPSTVEYHSACAIRCFAVELEVWSCLLMSRSVRSGLRTPRRCTSFAASQRLSMARWQSPPRAPARRA